MDLMWKNASGQVTVEAMVALPVVIAVAVITVNALVLLGECAAFDRLARDAVRAQATAPAYGESTASCAARVEGELAARFDAAYESVSVRTEGRSPGYVRFVARLEFRPNLFGRPFSGSAFGVQLAPIAHETALTIDPYKPGAIL